MCRRLAAELTELRPEFEAAGARLAVVTGTDVGAQEFTDAVWQGGDIYVDSAETFKRALGGKARQNWNILRPSVMRNIVGFVKRFGHDEQDIKDPKTQMLGGTLVLKDDKVRYVFRETATFDNGPAQAVLDAVKAL